MGWISEIGDNIGRGFQGVSDRMNAPDYYKWSVLPFMITFVVLVMLVGPFAYKGMKNLNVCTNQSEERDGAVTVVEVCKPTSVNPFFRIVIILFASSIIASIVSSITFQTGIYVKNPKMAMGIETTRIVKGVFSSKS